LAVDVTDVVDSDVVCVMIAAVVNRSRDLRRDLCRPHSRLRAHRNDQHVPRQHRVITRASCRCRVASRRCLCCLVCGWSSPDVDILVCGLLIHFISSRHYRTVTCDYCLSALAYTTACTTVQAVIRCYIVGPSG